MKIDDNELLSAHNDSNTTKFEITRIAPPQ